jgi:hypothetical protein
VQHRRDTEQGFLTTRSELEQRLRGRGEERVEDRLTAKCREPVKLRRKRENDMKVANGQDAPRALLNPRALRCALAFRTMPIATGVVRRLRKAAAAAHIEMAAKLGCPTRYDRTEHLGLLGGNGIGTPKRPTKRADDIR